MAEATGWKRWLSWAAAAALAAPVAIVLHELAHFLAGLAFGFPDLALHYGNVSDGAAKAGFPLWQQGVQAAVGPLATLLIVLGCCVATLRVGPKPWAVAPAFAAGVRSVGIGVAYLVVRILGNPAQGNFDEMNAAMGLGVAPELVIAVNVFLLLGMWIFLLSRVPSGHRLAIVSAVVSGTIVGVVVYVGWLGPVVLP